MSATWQPSWLVPGKSNLRSPAAFPYSPPLSPTPPTTTPPPSSPAFRPAAGASSLLASPSLGVASSAPPAVQSTGASGTPSPYGLASAAGGENVPASTPTYSVTHPEYFSGINMDALKTTFPDLYNKITKYQAGKGQLGQTYQYLIGRLGRAVTAGDVFSENDIRNAALSDRTAGAADWYTREQQAQDAAAQGGMMDSGDTGKYLAVEGAKADLAAEQAAQQRIADLTNYNQEFKYQSLQDAISALQEWANNRRQQRQSTAGADAMLAQANGMADAQRAAGAWGAASGLLGAGAGLAAGYIKH